MSEAARGGCSQRQEVCLRMAREVVTGGSAADAGPGSEEGAVTATRTVVWHPAPRFGEHGLLVEVGPGFGVGIWGRRRYTLRSRCVSMSSQHHALKGSRR